MKIIRILSIAIFSQLSHNVSAQIDIKKQLDEIPEMVSQYVDFLMYDITNYQGATYLNSLNKTGKVLDQWELSIGLNAGTALVPALHNEPLTFSQNFEINGSDPSVYWSGPNLFGSTGEGDIFFRFIDEEVGGPIYDPFTGEKIGFSVPLIAGLGTGVAFSPAIMPKISLGTGFGTEISFSALPGALKPLVNSFPVDFSISKDLMYAMGIKHDVFSWIPELNKRNYHLSIGIAYNSMQLGLEMGDNNSLFGDYESQADYYTLNDNFRGIHYGLTGFGYEGIASKSFGWIDLSLFVSSNHTNYQIKSEGDLMMSVNTSFKKNSEAVFEDFTLDNLVDVDKDVRSFLYGAAIQFKLGGFGLGLKYAYQNGVLTDHGRIPGPHYFSTSISYAFHLVKTKMQ